MTVLILTNGVMAAMSEGMINADSIVINIASNVKANWPLTGSSGFFNRDVTLEAAYNVRPMDASDLDSRNL